MRIKIDHISRRGHGRTAADTQATMQVFQSQGRGVSWTQGGPGLMGTTAVTMYSAATGGSTATTISPRTDGSGIYDWWVPEPGLYYLVETIDGATMPGVAWAAVQGRADDWITMTPLLNSWIADGTTPPAYTRDSCGIVYLRGKATRGVAGTQVMFNLPAEYRPDQVVTKHVQGAATFDILVNGDVQPTVATADVWLSVLIFRSSLF